jgi:hypothetical protein
MPAARPTAEGGETRGRAGRGSRVSCLDDDRPRGLVAFGLYALVVSGITQNVGHGLGMG